MILQKKYKSNRFFILSFFLFFYPFILSQSTNDETVDYLQSEKVISKNSPWRKIQESIHDTVMQIFVVAAEFDWIEPYRTPNQHTARGSGFFINDNGDFITNAHVVDQAVGVWICIPSLGKRLLKAEIIGICPERDIALLTLDEPSRTIVKDALGTIDYLTLGDSDTIYRADEVLALGYPLGQESLKSTTGVVSGREQHYIQMDAAINPGSSGGPLFNTEGEVIGINTAGVVDAQRVGYAIPINIMKMVLPDLYSNKLLRKPFLGILSIRANDELTDYLNNPRPGGCYIADVQKNSPIANAGVQTGDMIYEIDGNKLDVYGELSVPWSEDKISFVDYIARLTLGQEVKLLVYRNGVPLTLTVKTDVSDPGSIRTYYPWHEQVDYEVFAGMVVMPLTINHIRMLADRAPGLKLYSVVSYQSEPRLVITNIFPDSELARIQSIAPGFTLNEINGQKVETLDDFRNAIKKSIDTGYIVIRATDEITRMSENIFAVLSFDTACRETMRLSHLYRFPISETVKILLERRS